MGDRTRLGPPLSAEDVTVLTEAIGGQIMPLFRLFGTTWAYVVGMLVVLAIFKVVAGCLVRAYILYRERGAGWWMLAAIWHTAFLVIRVPWVTVQEAMEQVTAPLYDPRGSGGQFLPMGPVQTAGPEQEPYHPLAQQVHGLRTKEDTAPGAAPLRPGP